MAVDTEGGPSFWKRAQDRSLPQGKKKKKSIFGSRVEMRAAMLSLKLMKSVCNPEAH